MITKKYEVKTDGPWTPDPPPPFHQIIAWATELKRQPYPKPGPFKHSLFGVRPLGRGGGGGASSRRPNLARHTRRHIDLPIL